MISEQEQVVLAREKVVHAVSEFAVALVEDGHTLVVKSLLNWKSEARKKVGRGR